MLQIHSAIPKELNVSERDFQKKSKINPFEGELEYFPIFVHTTWYQNLT